MSWEEKNIESIVKQGKGNLVSGPFGSNISRKYFVDDGVPVIRGNNLPKDFTKFSDDGFVYITEEKAFELKNCITVKDDIIFTSAGTVGDVGIIPQKTRFEKYIISNKQIRLRIDTDIVYPLYVYYWLKQNSIKQQIVNLNTGSSIPLLTLGSVKKISFSYPKSLQTQKRIASILSAYDDLIENNLKRIKLLEETAQNIYKEWFVNFRFPNYENTPFNKETGLPEGWEKGLADDTYNINIGKTPPRGETQWFSVQEGIKWVSIADMNKSSVFISQTNERITKDGVDKFNMRLANEGSVLLSFKLTVGAVVIASEEVVTNEAIAHFNMLEDSVLSKEYTYCFLKNFNYQSLGSTSSIGTSINSKIVKSMIIVIPTENLISDFTLRVRGVFTQIQNLTFQNQKLKEARDILLPRLMNRTIEV